MQDSQATVLIADHNGQDCQRLGELLEKEGFSVRAVAEGKALLDNLQREIPELIVLDLQLPDSYGLEVCRRIKRHGDVPILVLTALADEDTKLRALDLYAEDYVQKPANLAEVVIRIKRILRRSWLSCFSISSTVRVDESLSLDFLRREARTPEGVFRLTPLESRLLQLLVQNAGQVLPSSLLLERLWGDDSGSTANLWEYVRRVRRKIGDDAACPRYVLNEPGLGYRFSGPLPSRN